MKEILISQVLENEEMEWPDGGVGKAVSNWNLQNMGCLSTKSLYIPTLV